MRPASTHQALRVVLLALALLELLGGLLLLFAPGRLLYALPASLHIAAASNFVTALLKFFGVLALTFAYLTYSASREPARYIAIIDAIIFLLIAAAIIDVYAVTVLGLGTYLPSTYVWVRAAVRIALAVLLFVLRPRRTP